MSSSKSSPARSKKESFNKELVDFDLLYQLTYLSSVAAAGVPRSQMFGLAAELPCTTSRYFRQVDRLAHNMNYQYAEACRIVGDSVREPQIKRMFLRLSSSMGTGEDPSDFMNREAQVQAETYGNAYERRLEGLRKWTDAYIALMVSVVLVIVVASISMVIYDVGTSLVMGLGGVMMGVGGVGFWVIYRTAPAEIKTLAGEFGSDSQKMPRRPFLVLVPSALIAAALLSAAGASLGWVLIVAGLMLLPIGVSGWMLDNRVNRLDGDLATFLRSLGTTASSIGTTPVEAISRMDLRSLGSLAPGVKRLFVMLRSRVAPELCWQRFVRESGSELVNRGSRVFLDGIRLGGDAGEVGDRASLMAMRVAFMREKRKLVSSTFGWLVLAMHATAVFLLVFVLEIVASFGRTIQQAGIFDAATGGPGLTSVLNFSFSNMIILQWLLIPIVILLCVVNALTAHVTAGGYSHTFFFYLGNTLGMGGTALVMAPKLAGMLFQVSPGGL